MTAIEDIVITKYVSAGMPQGKRSGELVQQGRNHSCPESFRSSPTPPRGNTTAGSRLCKLHAGRRWRENMKVIVDDYISGGYFATIATARPDWGEVGPQLLPDYIITASRCIGQILPDDWALEWVQVDDSKRAERANYFGIPHSDIMRFIHCISSAFEEDEVRYPGTFVWLDTARNVIQEFVPREQSLSLPGPGLHKKFLENFLTAEIIIPGMGNGGVWQCALERRAIASGGLSLGYEVPGYEYGVFHSWIYRLEVDADRDYGIHPSVPGLLSSLEQASIVAEYASREDVGAEPVLWLPWLLTQYDIE